MVDRALQKHKARHKRRRNRIAKDMHLNKGMHERTYRDKKRALKQDRNREQKEVREYLEHELNETDRDDLHSKVRF